MPSIAEAKRQVTLDALARATQEILLARGLDFTMDDVAAAAAVSRSTLFRHFATRDELIRAAARVGQADFAAHLPVYQGGDWRAWLRDLCRVIHDENASAGRVFLLATGSDTLPGPLGAVGRDVDEVRRGRYPDMATTLWRASGHDGQAPEHWVTVIATHLSPFFTAAVQHEAGADPAAAARMAEAAIAGLVDAHPGTPGPQVRPSSSPVNAANTSATAAAGTTASMRQ